MGLGCVVQVARICVRVCSRRLHNPVIICESLRGHVSQCGMGLQAACAMPGKLRLMSLQTPVGILKLLQPTTWAFGYGVATTSALA